MAIALSGLTYNQGFASLSGFWEDAYVTQFGSAAIHADRDTDSPKAAQQAEFIGRLQRVLIIANDFQAGWSLPLWPHLMSHSLVGRTVWIGKDNRDQIAALNYFFAWLAPSRMMLRAMTSRWIWLVPS